MAIIVSEGSGTNFKQVPPGSYPARCYGVIALGTAWDDMYKKMKNTVMLQFELPSETIDAPDNPELHGQPYGLSMFLSRSLHEKSTLRLNLERWRNKPFTAEELLGFDLKNVIGAPCMLSVVKSDSGKSKISSISALPKGMTVLPQINKTVYFDLSDFTHFDDLSEGIQKMIRKSDEWKMYADSNQGQNAGAEIPPEFDDESDIPF